MNLAILSGMRRNITLFALGIAATLTLPPFYIFPLVIPAYGGLFLFLNNAPTRKRAFADGFWWGWGFYISGLYWFTIALLTEPDKFAWLIPFALFALTAVIALYTALFATLYYKVRRKGAWGALIFASLWLLVEYARGHLFSGFPWNLGGYVFGASDASIQIASLVGAYGLTFFIVWLGALCATGKRNALIAICLCAASVGWGAYRLKDAPQEFVEGIKLRLVQANIAQHHKWDPALQMQGVREHIALTHSQGLDEITHVIWPETAVPYAIRGEGTLTRRLSETLLPEQYLITGALRLQEKGPDDYDLYNSIVMVDGEGRLVGSYDKFKLVPFGEFLPGRFLIPKGWKTPVGDRDFARGVGPQVLDWPGLPPVSPLICYEVIYPHLIPSGDQRPSWLLSVTNDAWFGTSTAPYQHLAMARMRAVEQGLPMVRAANTGISAVFDPYGREIARLELGKKGILDVRLPEMIQKDTIYTRIFY